MARTKQRLINYHTSGTTLPATGDVQGGEIVVRNNETRPELLIRAGSGFAVFEASAAVKTRIDNAIKKAQTNLEGQIDALTTATGILNTAISNVSGAVKTNYALKTEVEAVDDKLAGYATTATTNSLGTRLTEAEGDIEALTAATGTLNTAISNVSGAVTTNYATKTTAQGYANAASAQAKTYVDTQLTGYAKTSVTNALDSRIDALEAVSGQSHTHGNKGVLDGITSGKVANWDTAYNQRHTHDNKATLDDITSTKTSHWDTAYAKATGAVQSVKVTGVTGVDVTGTTAVTIDMTDLVIDCGEF